MGREVKRVALDFSWPIDKVWPGYLLSLCDEEADNCTTCKDFARIVGMEITDYGCPKCTIDPPEGSGWQMWETVSEGSPVSPVFETAEELARWLADNIGPSDVTYGIPYDRWLGMIKVGIAPSMIMTKTDAGCILETGVAAVGRKE